MYLGKDDETDVQVKDVAASSEKMSNSMFSVFGLTMFAVVFGFVWMVVMGVFYFIAVERVLEILHFDWSIWVVVAVAFVSYLALGTLGNIIALRLTEAVSVFGLLSMLSVFDGTSVGVQVVISVVLMFVFTATVMAFNYMHRKSLGDFTKVFRR